MWRYVSEASVCGGRRRESVEEKSGRGVKRDIAERRKSGAEEKRGKEMWKRGVKREE